MTKKTFKKCNISLLLIALVLASIYLSNNKIYNIPAYIAYGLMNVHLFGELYYVFIKKIYDNDINKINFKETFQSFRKKDLLTLILSTITIFAIISTYDYGYLLIPFFMYVITNAFFLRLEAMEVEKEKENN